MEKQRATSGKALAHSCWLAAKSARALSSEWLDWDTFYQAVGPAPKNHVLSRYREEEPFGPGNGFWEHPNVRQLRRRLANKD